MSVQMALVIHRLDVKTFRGLTDVAVPKEPLEMHILIQDAVYRINATKIPTAQTTCPVSMESARILAR